MRKPHVFPSLPLFGILFSGLFRGSHPFVKAILKETVGQMYFVAAFSGVPILLLSLF